MPRKILVVDDHLDTAENLAQLFRAAGNDARFALSGAAALGVIRDFKPDIAFVDLLLPDISGPQLVMKMRGLGALYGCRFVAITGHVGEEEQRRAVQVGCERVLLKPLDPEELDQLVGS